MVGLRVASGFIRLLRPLALDESVTDDEESIRPKLELVATAFRNDEKAKRLMRASQWLLDGKIGANELLSFVQTTVAMEILLGEESKSDVIGLGELLRNRCAYLILIGQTRTERDTILKDFGDIYDIRSKMVHRGKSRLDSREKTLFHKLQWIITRG